MAVNPDDFIFHSSFWYPTDYISGHVPLVSGEVLLSNQYSAGDYYAGYTEFISGSDTYVYYRFPGDTFWLYTTGNNLYAHKFQSGAGNIHYRIYKRPEKFNFISRGKLEKVLFRKVGTWNTSAGSTHVVDVAADTSELFYVKGIWRINGGAWRGIDTITPNGTVAAYQKKGVSTNVIELFSFSIAAGNSIDFELIGIKLYD